MNWLAISFLAFSQALLADKPYIDEDALKFLQELYEKSRSDQENCLCNKTKSPIGTSSPLLSFADKTQSDSKIKIFMSFSVPIETWLEYSKDLEKLNGVFVIRGLPENSFGTFSRKVMEFRKKEITAPIQIDPEAFELYKIASVPTIVLEGKSAWDKIEGNLRLDASLQLIVENGSNKLFAKECLGSLAGQNVSNVGKIQTTEKRAE